MNHRPHYPPTASQQQNNQENQLSLDIISSGAEILIIVIWIIGIWKYIVVPMWKGVIVPLWNWWNRSFTLTEKLILLALLALAGYLCLQVFLALMRLSMSY
jgi:hypothetical protein